MHLRLSMKSVLLNVPVMIAAIAIATAIASPLAAQPLKTGDIILLRSRTAGTYLSADPVNQKLNLAANTAGWEQWRYAKRNEGPPLTSFHGSTISLTTEPPYHAASYEGDPLFALLPVAFRNKPGEYGWFQTFAAPVSGDNVIVCGENRGLLTESNGSPHLGTCSNAGPYADSHVWQATLATNTDPNRRPLQKTMYDNYRYYLKTSANDYLQFDYPARSGSGGSGYFLPGQVTHRAAKPGAFQQKITATSTSDRTLKYGAAIWIQWPYDGGTFMMQPDPAGVNVVTGGSGGTETAWTIVDTTGTHKNGDRIPLGAKFCLKSSKGTQASADPRTPNVKLSPNCSDWESWFAEQP